MPAPVDVEGVEGTGTGQHAQIRDRHQAPQSMARKDPG